MRALVQRVSSASVTVAGTKMASIDSGLLVLLGIGKDDTPEIADKLADKVRALRVFPDEEGNFNDPLGDRQILVVSQFTLYANTSKGNRPSFAEAAKPGDARPLYERFSERLDAQRGLFGANMDVELVNDGPVTVMLEI
jgi:D-tyrosyl-tRNA(Tyr) deacylase